MEIIIVHLTDVHIRDESDLDVLVDRAASLKNAVCGHITDPANSAILICATGDLAYSGQEDQYVIFEMILNEICRGISDEFADINIYTAFVPGNHDCDFDDENARLRGVVLNSQELDIMDQTQIKICTSIQKNYFSFISRWSEGHPAFSCRPESIFSSYKICIREGEPCIVLHCLNTAWCSELHEEKGKMRLAGGIVKKLSSESADSAPDDIVITLMHHDEGWLDWEGRREWDEYLKEYPDIVLVGHEHLAEHVLRRNYDESGNYFIRGNQLYDESNPGQSGFSILKIDSGCSPMKECFFTYEWDGSIYKKAIDVDWRTFEKTRYRGHGMGLKRETREFLEKMDIDIGCGSRKDLRLSDVFAFPTLREEKDNGGFIRDMPSLIEHAESHHLICIYGRKEYGKTSLLKQLFECMYGKGKFPVFINVNEVNIVNGEALNRFFQDRYGRIYNSPDAELIMQMSRDDRACLIDDFEKAKMNDDDTKALLRYLEGKFGCVVLTRGMALDFVDSLDYMKTKGYIKDKFSILSILPTAHTSRERIIDRWLQLNGNAAADTVEFDAARKAKVAQLDAVMQTNYFNKTPVDLLIVLSYLEEDHSASLDFSRYSYIYDELILRKLNAIAAGMGRNTSSYSSMYKTILQNLAYKAYTDGNRENMDAKYIIDVIADYKNNYTNSRLDEVSTLGRLVEYRFLEEQSGAYRFKHGYIYYYFAGSYIESSLSPDVRDGVIREIFRNIDCDVNYNIALFLAYRMNIEYEIIPIVKEYGECLLGKFSDFEYSDLKKLFEKWNVDLDEKFNLAYEVPDNEEIPNIRKRRMEKREEAISEDDAGNERELDDINSTGAGELRLLNEDVVKTARYMDFVGSLLKNYCGKMDNNTRAEGIDFILRSSLKIVGAFCSLYGYVVEGLQRVIEEKIRDGSDEDLAPSSEICRMIKEEFATILSVFLEIDFTAAAESIESEMLRDDVAKYRELHGTEFVRMAELEYLIRISDVRLPVRKIRELFAGKNKLDNFSQGILKNKIYAYLTSFQYDRNDRQSVCSILGFNYRDVTIRGDKAEAFSRRP